MFEDIEPYFGWLHLYSHEQDEHSPFHDVEHNLFEYDRHIYTFNAHPLWDTIDSESLLVKILYVDYHTGFAIIELLGEWNDLFDNDFRLLIENCLQYLTDFEVYRFIFICENVFNIYLQDDDYYQAFYEDLIENEGWMCLLKARPMVIEEFERYNIGRFFYWNAQHDELKWRKLHPLQLYQTIDQSMHKLLS
jgi:hypothetical protein